MSTPSSTDGIAARLRRLRGEESQDAFSRKIGLTRSALANYETGRTAPKRSILRKICQRLGISESALIDSEAHDYTDLLGAMGVYKEAGTLPGLTNDEKAFVRLLRLCRWEAVEHIAKAILTDLEQSGAARDFADPLTSVDDLVAVSKIVEHKGLYEKCMSPNAFDALSELIKEKREK